MVHLYDSCAGCRYCCEYCVCLYDCGLVAAEGATGAGADGAAGTWAPRHGVRVQRCSPAEEAPVCYVWGHISERFAFYTRSAAALAGGSRACRWSHPHHNQQRLSAGRHIANKWLAQGRSATHAETRVHSTSCQAKTALYGHMEKNPQAGLTPLNATQDPTKWWEFMTMR